MGYFITESKDQDLGCHAHATETRRAVYSCDHCHITYRYNIYNGRANGCADSSAQCGTDSFTNAAAPTAIASLATTRLAAGHNPYHKCSDTVTHACCA